MAVKKARFFKKAKKELHPSSVKKEAISKQVSHVIEKVEKKERKAQFPKIPRIITEKIAFSFILWIAVVCVILMVFKLIPAWHQEQQAQKEYQAQTADLKEWEAIIQKYPSYRDAYFEAAVLAYRLGDKEKEFQLLQQLEQIDPNFSMTQQLQKLN